MKDYIPLLVILVILAAIMREDAVLTAFYLIIGVFLLGRWWSRKALQAVSYQRVYTNRAFLNDTVAVRLDLTNTGSLPVLWLQTHESLPVALAGNNHLNQVLGLRGHEKRSLQYTLYAQKRGYYPLGPLFLRTGDFLGLGEDDENAGVTDHLVVYPQIIPLAGIGLPSRSPYGSLKHHQPIYEDPSKVYGKRDYQSGDSLRRIDWKSSAGTGKLQVKKFEASISLETAIFLDLDVSGYDFHTRFFASELAIVVAASIANWLTNKKQAVGLFTNGSDPLEDHCILQPLPPKKGRSHLTRILDHLARVEVGQDHPFSAFLRDQRQHLTWGTTLVVIAATLEETSLHELYQSRKSGVNPLIILVGKTPDFADIKRSVEHFGVSIYRVTREKDLDAWRS